MLAVGEARLLLLILASWLRVKPRGSWSWGARPGSGVSGNIRRPFH